MSLWRSSYLSAGDTESKPSEGSISLGIACCTSTRGDYLTGSKDNKIWVDDFEWVY